MARNINPAKFVLAQNSAMWVMKATSAEMKIMGLQSMGLALGFSQQEKEIPMMGERISPKVFTGASYDTMTANNNFIEGDPTQEYLRSAALTGTMIKAIRLYTKDGCHFSAPDQPNSTSVAGVGGYTSGMSGLNIGSYTDPQAGAPSDTYTNTVSFAPGGPFALFIAHSEPNKGDEITITGGGAGVAVEFTTTGVDWADRGFDVGDTVIVDWSDTTPKYGVISVIADKVLTLAADKGDAATITTGVMPAMGALHGASPSNVSAMDVSC